MSNAGSLDGFRVIDLTQGLCGPFCTMQLGDAGAEVIKIEPPAGDFARRIGPPFVGNESAVFLSLNRNKKSVVLDLETSHGRAAAARLARDADALVEDFGTGAAEKFGLGYAQLQGANPKLVYC
jgi:CoA:oxalate CoA-transferase